MSPETRRKMFTRACNLATQRGEAASAFGDALALAANRESKLADRGLGSYEATINLHRAAADAYDRAAREHGVAHAASTVVCSITGVRV